MTLSSRYSASRRLSGETGSYSRARLGVFTNIVRQLAYFSLGAHLEFGGYHIKGDVLFQLSTGA